MSEELHLVTDLAVILIAAGVFTILFKALKQPLILGYIIAGFLVGPHLGLFPELTSAEAVSQWSEIGIIFLLFSLGLEFSVKKLLKVGSTALIMAVTICICMFVVGMVTGSALGWTSMEGLFLGGMMSMSSTTIILKAYTDMGLRGKPWSGMIFGCLVVEDLIAVLLMVLLSTLAVSSQSAGKEMILGLGKLVVFLILCFLVGIYALPSLLKKAGRYLTDEILLIVSIGLCFGMVALANFAGFSSALGAFVMGSLLAETIESERIIKLTGSIKDLFGAIFFVSVGMMVDPAIIGQYWVVILILTAVAMLGLLGSSTLGGLLAGQGVRNSVHAGFSLPQLGEFSFIIASLGVSLGVLRGFIYPVIIAVSVITTFLTPYMIKAGDPVSDWLYRILPSSLIARLDPKPGEKRASGAAEQSEWRKLMQALLLRMTLYGVPMIAIMVASSVWFHPMLGRVLSHWSGTAVSALGCAATLAALAPFAAGFVVNSAPMKQSIHRLLLAKGINRWPVISIFVMRTALVVGMVVIVISGYFHLSFWSILLIVLAVFAVVFFGRGAIRSDALMEKRFMSNFNEKERLQMESQPVRTSLNSKLSGYDVHIETLDVSPDSYYIGKSLRDLPFRHRSGANIVKIKRGNRSILIPGGDEVIYPGDRLIAVGTTEQIESFKALMAEGTQAPSPEDTQVFTVEKLVLDSDSLYIGKSLRDVSMRQFGCMVISIIRDGHVITNPGPDEIFREGDTIWIAGEKSGVERCIS